MEFTTHDVSDLVRMVQQGGLVVPPDLWPQEIPTTAALSLFERIDRGQPIGAFTVSSDWDTRRRLTLADGAYRLAILLGALQPGHELTPPGARGLGTMVLRSAASGSGVRKAARSPKAGPRIGIGTGDPAELPLASLQETMTFLAWSRSFRDAESDDVRYREVVSDAEQFAGLVKRYSVPVITVTEADPHLRDLMNRSLHHGA